MSDQDWRNCNGGATEVTRTLEREVIEMKEEENGGTVLEHTNLRIQMKNGVAR